MAEARSGDRKSSNSCIETIQMWPRDESHSSIKMIKFGKITVPEKAEHCHRNCLLLSASLHLHIGRYHHVKVRKSYGLATYRSRVTTND